MVWNIKYLVYNNVKWPGPELWCRGGFSVCFVVYGFEILIFCCRLIRLSGLGEWIMVCASAAFWGIGRVRMLTSSRPTWGHVQDVLSVFILMCQSLQRRGEMSDSQSYVLNYTEQHTTSSSGDVCPYLKSFSSFLFTLKLLRCLRGVYQFTSPPPVII